MGFGGYMGKILYVNLTTGDVKKEAIDHKLIRGFVGDFGISVRLAYDLIKPGINPLSPENVILIGAGPFAGTGVPGASRSHCVTKYPMSHTIGLGGASMSFSNRLKWSGYDHLVITGRADKPVYLRISDSDVEICDSRNLWGRDIYEATDEMWKRHGTDCGVICIGEAGENQVKLAEAFVDKNATMGRLGLGAVMGSKNLKLITAGGKRGVRIADRSRFVELVDELMTDIMSWPERANLINLGPMQWNFDGLAGITTTRNYMTETFDIDHLREIFGPNAYLEKIKKARFACQACPLACRDIWEVKEGDHKGLRSYQQGATFSGGARMLLQSMEDNAKFRDTMNRYGIDYFGFVGGVEFLLDLIKRGIIPKDTLEGYDGSIEEIVKLAKKVARRQGIGDVLADGLEGVIRKFGKKCEKYGIHIKGTHAFMETRLPKMGCQQFDLVVNPAGPIAGKGGTLNPGKYDPNVSLEAFVRYCGRLAIPKEAIDRIVNTPQKINIPRLTRHTEDGYMVFCLLSQCMRPHINQFYTISRMAELYSAVTGIKMNEVDLKKAGERAWNMMKVLNMREGFSRKDDVFPPRWLEPLNEGTTNEIPPMDFFGTKVLTAVDMEKMLDDYYDERGWDMEKGIPTKDKLIELELGWVVRDLEGAGIL
jgi:aldehyde:ferredoxin oxidoreductase